MIVSFGSGSNSIYMYRSAMIVYEKRAPLPLLSSPSAQIVKCIVIIQIYFPLLKAKLYLKISIHACFMTHTCNFLVFGNTSTQNGANICDLSLPTKVAF